MKSVLCLDLLNAFFSLRHTKERDPLWRFINDIRNIIAAGNFDKTVLALDVGQSQYRLKKYPQYKEKRRERRAQATDKEKLELEQFFGIVDQFKEMAPIFGLEVAGIKGCEADDLIAYFARKAGPDTYNASILSSDSDLLQLLTPYVCQRAYADKMELEGVAIPPQVYITEKRFIEIMEMSPSQYSEAKSISGDTGDSIYSPEGVGKETGYKLIRKYGSIAEVEKNLDNLDIPRLTTRAKENLKKDFWMVHRNVELVSLLHTDEKFLEIFGEKGLQQLQDILARINTPPVVDCERLKEYLFETGRVNVYYDFDNWVRPFLGRRN